MIQRIAGDDQVYPREWRVGRRTLAGKDEHVPNRIADPISAVAPVKEASQPLRRDILDNIRRISCRAGVPNRFQIGVGGEDLDPDMCAAAFAEFSKGDANRISFFTSRAAG